MKCPARTCQREIEPPVLSSWTGRHQEMACPHCGADLQWHEGNPNLARLGSIRVIPDSCPPSCPQHRGSALTPIFS
jgi:hypothetical protein